MWNFRWRIQTTKFLRAIFPTRKKASFVAVSRANFFKCARVIFLSRKKMRDLWRQVVQFFFKYAQVFSRAIFFNFARNFLPRNFFHACFFEGIYHRRFFSIVTYQADFFKREIFPHLIFPRFFANAFYKFVRRSFQVAIFWFQFLGIRIANFLKRKIFHAQFFSSAFCKSMLRFFQL